MPPVSVCFHCSFSRKKQCKRLLSCLPGALLCEQRACFAFVLFVRLRRRNRIWANATTLVACSSSSQTQLEPLGQQCHVILTLCDCPMHQSGKVARARARAKSRLAFDDGEIQEEVLRQAQVLRLSLPRGPVGI